MILRTEEFQKNCSILSLAVENNSLLQNSSILQLEVIDSNLLMKMNNVEHYEEVIIPITSPEEFNASVEGNMFLSLVGKITSETIELILKESNLIIKGNGTYKLPLIFESDKMFEVKKFMPDVITTSFDISTDILMSINYYNNKELLRGTANNPVQNLHYMDEAGAITFNTGACVNSFNLNASFKMLLNSRIVALFKMFELNGDSQVKVDLGYYVVNNTNRRLIVLSSSTLSLTYLLLSEDTLLNAVPVSILRGRANKLYDYKVTLDKGLLLETLSRLALFIPKDDFYIKAKFNAHDVTFGDENNHESIFYSSSSSQISEYSLVIDLRVFLDVIKTITSKFISINFGDHEAFTITNNNIVHILPEVDVV